MRFDIENHEIIDNELDKKKTKAVIGFWESFTPETKKEFWL